MQDFLYKSCMLGKLRKKNDKILSAATENQQIKG